MTLADTEEDFYYSLALTKNDADTKYCTTGMKTKDSTKWEENVDVKLVKYSW